MRTCLIADNPQIEQAPPFITPGSDPAAQIQGFRQILSGTMVISLFPVELPDVVQDHHLQRVILQLLSQFQTPEVVLGCLGGLSQIDIDNGEVLLYSRLEPQIALTPCYLQHLKIEREGFGEVPGKTVGGGKKIS